MEFEWAFFRFFPGKCRQHLLASGQLRSRERSGATEILSSRLTLIRDWRHSSFVRENDMKARMAPEMPRPRFASTRLTSLPGEKR